MTVRLADCREALRLANSADTGSKSDGLHCVLPILLHLMLVSKKVISALQWQRVMGFSSYRTAWHICHRIPAGLMDLDLQELMGIAEVDETFVGRKKKSKHWDKCLPSGRNTDVSTAVKAC